MRVRAAWLSAAVFLLAFALADGLLELWADTPTQRVVRIVIVAVMVAFALAIAVNARVQGALEALQELLPLLRRSLPNADLTLLTPREREVARLIARGLTSREIADVLVISERTADTHADHIRQKLGLRSRAEIASWAREHGLLQNG